MRRISWLKFLCFAGPTVAIGSFAIAFLLTLFKEELAGSVPSYAVPSVVLAIGFWGGIVAGILGAVGLVLTR